MERVHFYQEQMLPELKELEERGIFSQSETQAILKQRTTFESALVRRVALKSDFLKYVQYEVTLEALRKKRVARLNATETRTSLSDYCIVRRQFYILERAVRKFKGDVSLWVQYIEVAKSNNARSLVGKLCSRALSLHPTSPNLYIIAASHELDSTLSPTGARALLQRGLRINPESVALWTEYVRMELGYCEGLRRRWKTLGIDPTTPGEDAEAIQAIVSGGIARAVISSATQSLPTLELLGSLQNLLQSYPTELRATLLDFLHSEFAARDTGSGPAGEDFRCGAIVLRATIDIPSRPLENGAQLPKIPPLRPLVAAAFTGQATPFTPESQTGEFVKRIQKANESLSFISKTDLRVAELYARWVASWVPVITENTLRLYLVLALTTLAKQLCKQHHDTGLLPVLATVLRISLHLNKTTCMDEIQSRKLSQKFSKKCPDDVGLWLARLDAESGAMRPIDSELSIYTPPTTIPEPIHKLWAEAREKAKAHASEDDLLVQLWLWGLNHMKGSDSAAREEVWEAILRQSLSHISRTLHSELLFRRLYDIEMSSNERSLLARKLITQYRPSVLFFDLSMDHEVLLLLPEMGREANQEQVPPRKKQKQSQGTQTRVTNSIPRDYQCLEVLYNSWRIITDQQIPATLKWAKSLHQLGQEEEAEEAIRIAGGSKGKLKLEWERVRGVRGDKESSNVEQSSGDHAEKDVSLEKVEYN